MVCFVVLAFDIGDTAMFYIVDSKLQAMILCAAD